MRVIKPALFATSAAIALISVATEASAQAAPTADQQRPADCTSAAEVNHPTGACQRTDATTPQHTGAASSRANTPDNGINSPANSAPATASPDQTSTSGAASNEVTVTGSRLRNAEFNAITPVQTITAEEGALRGFADTAALIQSSTIAGNATQINNNFSGFIVNGGPGVNTVSLRGLGADRTLVLLNGKRLGPAGVSGSVSSVDLNTIPDSIIDRIDIVKDGSSSIYGSDAVAGIVNIITKQNLNGGDIHAYARPSFQGGDDVFDLSGDYGRKWDRGYVNASFDLYRQEALHFGDRDYLACKQDYAYNPTTHARIDLPGPGNIPGYDKCQNLLNSSFIDLTKGGYYLVTPGTARTAISPANLTRVNCTIYSTGLCTSSPGATIDVGATRASRGLVPTYGGDLYEDGSAVSPVRRYTTTVSAGYDVLPKYMTVYGDFLFNKRMSETVGTQQVFPPLDPANPTNPLPGSLIEPVVETPVRSSQDVNYYRGVVGVRGNLPDFHTLQNWHYDVSLQYSESQGSYSQDYIRLDRLNAATGPTACDVNYVNPNLGGDSIAMHEPGGACLPVNWANAIMNGIFTPAEAAYLRGHTTSHTTYDQGYVEGDFAGDLFRLPAGAVSADVGFHFRRDRINDLPSDEILSGNLYGYSTSGNTRGGQDVKEGFGELGIPILRDLPLVKSLLLDVSGRYSSYDTAGEAKTYKAAVRWQITSWLGVKYDQGTSFRAPALFERFLANQTGFLGQTTIDPCISYGSSGAAAVIQQRCAALGIPPDYVGNGGSAEVTAGGNNQSLTPETAFEKQVGVVFQPRWWGLNMNVEVDYYQNRISNTITQFGPANIINQCYSLPTYPNAYCNLFSRDPATFQIVSVTDNYLNVGQSVDRGIDLTIRSQFKLPYDVTFRFDSAHSWTLQEVTTLLPGTTTDYNGTSGAPRYVGNLNFRFDWHDWTLNWFVSLVGPTSDTKLVSDLVPSYRGTGVPAEYLERVNFYTVDNISVRKRFPGDVTAEVGLANAFDTRPPPFTNLDPQASSTGSTVLASQYDYVGRAVWFQVDKKF